MNDITQRSLSIMAERLSRADLFNQLEEEELLAIARFCTEETCLADEHVLSEGEEANYMFIVERGKLALEKRIQIGRHSTPRNATIGYVVPGKIAGFSTLTQPHIYATSAVTVEPSRVIKIDGESMRAYFQEHPAVGYLIMNNLSALIGERYRLSTNTLTYFLSIVSHELRSPLAAIENYLRTMLGGFVGDINPKQERMIKRSILRITDLRDLIGDVVDLARMRPEQIQVDFQWFDPSEVGTESIEDTRLAAAEKGIRIKVEPPPKFEPIVGARRRLRQVFTNLLNNAIKFSPSESVITFRAWYDADNVYFEVEDQGPGIPSDELTHIFKDFFRGSNIEGIPGTGLGLSIAKKIIDAHDGEILVTNELEDRDFTGSTFRVVIPRNLKTQEMKRQEWMVEGDQ
jgi:signal transduction histidine kinase